MLGRERTRTGQFFFCAGALIFMKPFETHFAEALLNLEMDVDQHFVHRLDNRLTGLLETRMT